MSTPVLLRDLVRAARKEKGWSQDKLGTLVGMSQRWVSDIERGDTDVPKRSLLHALATALDLDVARLYVAADLARSESSAKRADESAPMSEQDDPLYNVVFNELRQLAPEDLEAIRAIVRRLQQGER